MGEVYRARDTRLDRTVAVKVLPPSMAADGDRLQRFEHEARILSTLNHPNLLAIYDVGGEPRRIPGLKRDDAPVQWSEDGRSTYSFHLGALPSAVERIDMATGKRTRWKTLAPADLAGVHGISQVTMTRDGRVCLYSYLRTFSDLYLVQRVK